MITPKFKIEQTNEHLIIHIRVPYANVNEVEAYADSNDFRFFCKPYYLRLNLPGSLNEECLSSKYDVYKNSFELKYMKTNPGETFEGLDLLTKLLTAPVQGKSQQPPLIEEVDSDNGEEEDEYEEDDDEDEDGDKWFIQQDVNNESDDEASISIKTNDNRYGFALTKSNVFSKLNSEYLNVIDLPEPDSSGSTLSRRTKLRIENENSKFDEGHYLADYFDDSETIESSILKYVPEFYSFAAACDRSPPNQIEIEYTGKEIDILKSLPRKTYVLDKEQTLSAYLGLVDIMFAYCYTNRINCGEKNVESGWTISKLSSTLSWLSSFKSLDECILASFRRSLCYPLYRNLKLTRAVFRDLKTVFAIGRKLILKCLLEVRELLIDGECRYILNDLYINDYCIWIQHASDKKLKKLSECLQKIKINKSMIGFELEEIEEAGKLVYDEMNERSPAAEADEDNDQDNREVDEDDRSESESDEADLIINLDTLKLTPKEQTITMKNEKNNTTSQKPKIEELN